MAERDGYAVTADTLSVTIHGMSAPKRRLMMEAGDLVIHSGSEWTVHAVDDQGVAVLRKHNDPDLQGNTLKVRTDAVRPLVKARDR